MTARSTPTGPGNTGRTVVDFPASRPRPLPVPAWEKALRAARAGAIVAGLKLGLIVGGAL